MYSATILEHFRNPRNTGELIDPDGAGEAHNPLCGDRIRLFLRICGNTISEARFHAEACAICTAAASILTERVIGMDTTAAAMLSESQLIDALDTRLRAERRRCATLPLEALRAATTGPAKEKHQNSE